VWKTYHEQSSNFGRVLAKDTTYKSRNADGEENDKSGENAKFYHEIILIEIFLKINQLHDASVKGIMPSSNEFVDIAMGPHS
jgi:hypothetical protein